MRPMGDWSMWMMSLTYSTPSSARCLPGSTRLIVQHGVQLLVQDLVDQAALARARYAGDAGEHAQREGHIDVAQVVLPRAADRPGCARWGCAALPAGRCACCPRGTARSARPGRAGSRPPRRRRPPCPPCSPGPGPISMMWSAARMMASSCSTTTTELPRSRSRRSVSTIFWLS